MATYITRNTTLDVISRFVIEIVEEFASNSQDDKWDSIDKTAIDDVQEVLSTLRESSRLNKSMQGYLYSLLTVHAESAITKWVNEPWHREDIEVFLDDKYKYAEAIQWYCKDIISEY